MILAILVSISPRFRITEFVYREHIAGQAEVFYTLQLSLRFAFSVTKLIYSTSLTGVVGASDRN